MPWWAVLTDATICVPCPAGTAGISGRCSQCPPGSEPNDIRSECVVCIPGTFSVAGERCLTCPVGMGSDYLRAGCLSCPPGSVSTVGICSECDSGSRPIGAPVVEACTVVVGTITEENTAATTCMLTAFVAADPAANPAVVGVVGGCSVATGSGSCPYVAPVAGTAATCTGADDGAATPCTISGDATALGSSCYVPPVKSFAGNCVFDEAVVETAALCTGTNDGVASCTGVNDGSPAARACRLNEARDACAVQGGDCVFTAGVSTQAPHPHLDSRGFL